MKMTISRSRRTPLRTSALASAVALALAAAGGAAAQDRGYNIPSEPLANALRDYGRAAGRQLIFTEDLVRGLTAPELKGSYSADDALARLLEGTGLVSQLSPTGAVMIMKAAAGPKQEGTQESSDGFLPLDETIVITGTHIRGGENIGTPMISMSRDDIDRSGYSTTEALVASIPQNFAAFSGEGAGRITGGSFFSTQNVDYASSIDLRGLGPQSTLTLVDGQRVAGSVQGRVVDISTIPLAMIDHVDVLTDGNSAIYGSDAVGGVVNFVMRHTYDGAQTDAYVGGSVHGGDRIDASQVFGRTCDSGGFILGYDYARENSFNLVKAGLTEPTFGGEVNVNLPLVPDTARHSFYASGQFDVSDNVQLYGDASYVYRTETYSTDAEYPKFNEVILADYTRTLQGYNALAGAKIKLGGSWLLDLSGATSGTHIDLHSPETVETATTREITYQDHTTSAVTSGSAVLDGPVPIFALNGKAAIGGEFRRESFQFNVPAGESVFQQTDTDRLVQSVFAEFDLPLIPESGPTSPRRLDLSLAGRYDHYSDFGGSLNPQAGLQWQPMQGLKLRTSYATAFRAPDLWTLNEGSLEEILNESVCNPAGVCSTRPTLNLNYGNPSLRPETAKTYSFGFDVNPPDLKWLQISVSYFNVDYRNRIANPVEVLPASEANYPQYVFLNPTAAQVQQFLTVPGADAIQNYSGKPWNPATQSLLAAIPNLAIVDDRSVNVASELERGIDLSLKTKHDIAYGSLMFNLDGTYTLRHTVRDTPGSAALSVIDQVGLPAPLRIRAATGWTAGPVSATAFVNYVGSYENQYTVPVSRMGAWTTADFTLILDGSKLSVRKLEGWRATFSVQNLFNRTPPEFLESSAGIRYDPANASALGRFLALRITKQW
jgi:iron complex outermembrane receptor protein